VSRRDFLSLVSSAVFACPSFAKAQPTGKTRRIGIVLGLDENDADGRSWVKAFRQRLDALGWTDGAGSVNATGRSGPPLAALGHFVVIGGIWSTRADDVHGHRHTRRNSGGRVIRVRQDRCQRHPAGVVDMCCM
jgi:hypothetical protein